MNALLIETSTEKSGLALYANSQFLFKEYLPTGLQSSQHLLPVLEEKLRTYRFSPTQLDQIICGIGPGSYTGIRVGAITAKTLAFALNKPVMGVSTLKWFIPQQEGKFVVLIDAKIGGVYVIKGSKNKHEIVYESEPSLCPLNELRAYLGDSNWHILSPNLSQVRERIIQELPDLSVTWEETCPNFEHVASLRNSKDLGLIHGTQASLELLYLRKTQAEIEKEAKT